MKNAFIALTISLLIQSVAFAEWTQSEYDLAYRSCLEKSIEANHDKIAAISTDALAFFCGCSVAKASLAGVRFETKRAHLFARHLSAHGLNDCKREAIKRKPVSIHSPVSKNFTPKELIEFRTEMKSKAILKEYRF